MPSGALPTQMQRGQPKLLPQRLTVVMSPTMPSRLTTQMHWASIPQPEIIAVHLATDSQGMRTRTLSPEKTGIGTDAVSIVVSNAVVYLPLEDLVDREKETERLEKEKERLSKEIARCEGMLNNPGFVNKAPEQKVAAEKAKLEKYKEMREKVLAQLSHLA